MGYGMMEGPGAMGGWGMAFGGIMMIFWAVLMVALVVFLVRWFSGAGKAGTGPAQGSAASALNLLQQRYARGEIDSADFDERMQKLQHPPAG